MTNADKPLLIKIWLTPDEESSLTIVELAEMLGNKPNTQYDRVAKYGLDDDFTFYPGPIPMRMRKKYLGSGEAKFMGVSNRGGSTVIDPHMARLFVLKLIKRSKSAYLKNQCLKSRAFLLNEEDELYFFIELMFTDDVCRLYMKRLKQFVDDVDKAVSTGSLKSLRVRLLRTEGLCIDDD